MHPSSETTVADARGQVIVPIACFDAGSATCAPVQLRVVARARLLRVRRDPVVQDRTTDKPAKTKCARAKSRRRTPSPSAFVAQHRYRLCTATTAQKYRFRRSARGVNVHSRHGPSS